MSGPLATARTWGRMVRFSHSVFALPFALSGAALAALEHGIDARRVVWIVIAMVGARNAAMGFNRLVDHRLDAANPRTRDRELPRGALPRSAVWVFTLALAALFVVAAFMLSPLCGALSPVALAIVFGYSFAKRFTWGSHLWLGLALAIAPVGGWLAVAGSFAPAGPIDPVPWWLALAVVCWVAGFDVIYACQDADHDRAAGLFSMPQRFGVPGALGIARALHVAAVGAMAGVGVAAGLSPVYWAGVIVIAALLAWEHRLVRADDLDRLGTAFFTMNAVISAIYLATVLLEIGYRAVAD